MKSLNLFSNPGVPRVRPNMLGVRYGLWPSDSPEQLRCDGGEMLNNQIDILSAELTRKLHTAVHKKMYSKYVDRKEKKKAEGG